jgi:hypothetical protein
MRTPTTCLLTLLVGLALATQSQAQTAPKARGTKVAPVKVKGKSTSRAGRTANFPRAGTKLRTTRGQASKLRAQPSSKAKKTESLELPAYASKLREDLGKAVEANFKKFPNQAEALPKDRILYHSIKEVSHREQWKGKYAKQGLSMMGEWMTGGKYGGIWTTSKKEGLFGGEGWYSDKGSAAVRITLKKKALFIDLEDPAQKQIYKDWQKLSKQTDQHNPKDMFQTLKGPDGVPLAKRVGGLRAPTHGDFFKHLGIAGVIHYDAYGQGNPVLLNPHAIEKVEF